jgi:isopropylmalate/homocitrate/citramalate synthase
MMEHDITHGMTAPYFTESWWVSPMNFAPEAYPERLREQNVYIHDVTLRDGEQSPGVAFKKDERIRIAVALDDVGVHRIEVGMPIVSQGVFDAIKAIVDLGLRTEVVPQARAEIDDVNRTMETGARAIIIVHTINPLHCQHVFGLDTEAIIERINTSIAHARSQGLQAIFMGSDVFRTPLLEIREIYGRVAQESRPDAMVLTDTVGVATPGAVRFVTEQVRDVAPDSTLEFHGHNDFGLGMACAVAAVEAGCEGIHTSFNGLGERTGNVPTEEFAAAMRLLYDKDIGISLDKLCLVSEIIANIAQTPIRPGKPIVGGGLFEIESHIVAHISQRMSELGLRTGMVPFVPELVGQEPIRYALGKWSGPAIIDDFLSRCGVEATDAQKARILHRVKEESRLQKANLSQRQFSRIVDSVIDGQA